MHGIQRNLVYIPKYKQMISPKIFGFGKRKSLLMTSACNILDIIFVLFSFNNVQRLSHKICNS